MVKENENETLNINNLTISIKHLIVDFSLKNPRLLQQHTAMFTTWSLTSTEMTEVFYLVIGHNSRQQMGRQLLKSQLGLSV